MRFWSVSVRSVTMRPRICMDASWRIATQRMKNASVWGGGYHISMSSLLAAASPRDPCFPSSGEPTVESRGVLWPRSDATTCTLKPQSAANLTQTIRAALSDGRSAPKIISLRPLFIQRIKLGALEERQQCWRNSVFTENNSFPRNYPNLNRTWPNPNRISFATTCGLRPHWTYSDSLHIRSPLPAAFGRIEPYSDSFHIRSP